MADRGVDRLTEGNGGPLYPKRLTAHRWRFYTPTLAQRRMVGELILLGNRRRELAIAAVRAEHELRQAVLRAYQEHEVLKSVIAEAGSMSRQTVYQWLTEAGLYEPALGSAHSEISGEGETDG